MQNDYLTVYDQIHSPVRGCGDISCYTRVSPPIVGRDAFDGDDRRIFESVDGGVTMRQKRLVVF